MSEQRPKRPAMQWRCFGWAVFMGMLLGLTASASAESIAGPEYQVKAGFIYNFINFASWPESAFKNNNTPIRFFYAADDPAADVLLALDDKISGGRRIRVFKYSQDLDLSACHVFFFATDDKNLIREKLDLMKGWSILTIGETEGFTNLGGVINFFIENSRLRFQVNVTAVDRNGIKLSSQILRSAEIVKEER